MPHSAAGQAAADGRDRDVAAVDLVITCSGEWDSSDYILRAKWHCLGLRTVTSLPLKLRSKDVIAGPALSPKERSDLPWFGAFRYPGRTTRSRREGMDGPNAGLKWPPTAERTTWR